MTTIVQAISNQIKPLDESAEIYDEPVPQNFKEPSFYIYEIDAGSNDLIMGMAIRIHNYAITYFPDSDLTDENGYEIGLNQQCRDMRTKLFDNLLVLDDVNIHVRDREATIEGGALTFSFRLLYDVRKVEEGTAMGSLEQEGGLFYDS